MERLADLVTDQLALHAAAGAIALGRRNLVALQDPKIKANASKHKAMSSASTRRRTRNTVKARQAVQVPRMKAEAREAHLARWRKAVERA